MVDSWEKTDSLLFAGQILFSPDFGWEICCKQHFLEGSRRWGICGKWILWDTLHGLHGGQLRGTWHLLISVILPQSGCSLSSLAHKRPPSRGWWQKAGCWKGVWQWGLSHPFPWLPAAQMQVSHSYFHGSGLTSLAFEKLKIPDMVNVTKIQLIAPACAEGVTNCPWRQDVYSWNENTAVAGTINKAKHRLLTLHQ